MISLGNTMTLPEFERLLEVYGSDRTRWPVEARASAGQLTARDPAACRLLIEAEALDRILVRAPLPSLASEAALAERILAAAQRSPRMVRTGDAVASAPADGALTATPAGANRTRLCGSRIGGVGSIAVRPAALPVCWPPA